MTIHERPAAVARIRGGRSTPGISGTIKFYQKRGGILVVASVNGLPWDSATGIFALHIHEGTMCAGEGFSAAGGHFNPNHKLHPSHAGDLPPLFGCSGRAYLAVLTNRFTIGDVLGRTVVIHRNPDDFHTQPAGNAGDKIACGVICPV